MDAYNITVVGGAGIVGREFLKVLDAHKTSVKRLRLLATSRSAGKQVEFRGNQVTIMMPKYGSMALGSLEWRRKRIRLTINIKGKAIQGGVMDATWTNGATVTLFEQPTYFDRKGIFGAE